MHGPHAGGGAVRRFALVAPRDQIEHRTRAPEPGVRVRQRARVREEAENATGCAAIISSAREPLNATTFSRITRRNIESSLK